MMTAHYEVLAGSNEQNVFTLPSFRRYLFVSVLRFLSKFLFVTVSCYVLYCMHVRIAMITYASMQVQSIALAFEHPSVYIVLSTSNVTYIRTTTQCSSTSTIDCIEVLRVMQ